MNNRTGSENSVECKANLEKNYKQFLEELPPFGPIRVFWQLMVYHECKKRCRLFCFEEGAPLIECPICYEDITIEGIKSGDVSVFSCGHLFCSKCLKKSGWQKKCPTCKGESGLCKVSYRYVNRFVVLNQKANMLLNEMHCLLNKMTPHNKIDRDFGAKQLKEKEKHTCGKMVKNFVNTLFN